MVDSLTQQLQDLINDYIAEMQAIHDKRVILSNRDYALASKEVRCWDLLQQNLKTFEHQEIARGHVLSENQQSI